MCRGNAAVVDQPYNAVLVDSHVDGLADLDVVKRGLRDIHCHITRVKLVAYGDQLLVGGISHHLSKLRRRNAVADDVDFAALQPQHSHGRVLAEFKGDAVQVGNSLAEIVGVALQYDALARHPFNEFEGAGANRLLAPVRPGLLHFLLGHHIAEVDRHQVQESCIGTGEGYDDGAIVRGRNSRQFGRFAARYLIISLDHAEIAAAGALRGRIGGAFQRIFDIGRSYGAPIVKLQPIAKGECVGQAVIGDGVAFGQVGLQFGGARLVIHQAIENRFDDRPILPVIADMGIERRQIIVERHDGATALFRRLSNGTWHCGHHNQGGSNRNEDAFHRASPP